MRTVDGALRCMRGGMELSPNLRVALTEVFVTRSRPAKQRSAQMHSAGGAWFCPSCSTPMKSNGPNVTCPSCGHSLDEFIHTLIELHPHSR